MSKHCDTCSKHFQDDYALQGHLSGKKHLRRVEQVQSLERSIFVSPLPKSISKRSLVQFFEQYGSIKSHKFEPKYLIIEFCDSGPTEILLSKSVCIRNIKLNIQRKTLQNDVSATRPKRQKVPTEHQGVISYNNIQHIFNKTTAFDDQLVEFLNAVQLTDKEIKTKYDSICPQLNKIFKAVFPKCKTHKFGSTPIGLGFKECDLDIFLDIGEPIYETEDALPNAWTMQKVFKEVKKILYRTRYLFSNIISIPGARTPIIKFCYVPTKVSCDISFKNNLGLYKSNLLKQCISLDSRIRPLIMLIKYWARHFKLSGSGKISNFGLILLIIFYLQQPSVNIIPPLIVFLNIVDSEAGNVDLPPITNANSIPQLLYGFFFFYTTFPFEYNIICPIDGKIRSRLEFKKIDSLPPYMDKYKVYARQNQNHNFNLGKFMCVQDPVDLTCNTTAHIGDSVFRNFLGYCHLGSVICNTSRMNDYRDLMESLLTSIMKKEKDTKFNVEICATKFRHVMDAINEKKFTENDWYITILTMIKDIFEKVFLLAVNVLIYDARKKTHETCELSNVDSNNVNNIIFYCTGYNYVWPNRKQSSIVLDSNLSCLEKEALISEKTMENCAHGKIDFTCLIKKVQPLSIKLTVKQKMCYDEVFHEFSSFAKPKLIEIIQKTLIHMQKFNKCN